MRRAGLPKRQNGNACLRKGCPCVRMIDRPDKDLLKAVILFHKAQERGRVAGIQLVKVVYDEEPGPDDLVEHRHEKIDRKQVFPV